MRRIVAVAPLLVLAFALTGCSGGTAASTVAVPNVVGQSGADARDRLEEAGFDVDWDAGKQTVIIASNWTVDAASPSGRAESGATITLKVHKSSLDEASPSASETPSATPTPTETEDVGLNDVIAWRACQRAGEEIYQYGFKIHYLLGVLNIVKDESKWFGKAEVDVTNAYDATRKTTVQCVVKGTDDAPQVTALKVQ